MSTELIINASLPETRIALMESGEIQDLLIERASGKGIVGNIYKGRVTRVLPGMQAAFVDIGLEKAAFLYVDDVFVHSEVFEDEEGQEPQSQQQKVLAEVAGADRAASSVEGAASPQSAGAAKESATESENDAEIAAEAQEHLNDAEEGEDFEGDESEEGESSSSNDSSESSQEEGQEGSNEESHDEGQEDDEEEDFGDDPDQDDEEEDEEDEDHGHTEMGAEGGDGNDDQPAPSHPGTVSPQADSSSTGNSEVGVIVASGAQGGEGQGEGDADGDKGARRGRHRRGRRGGKFRRRTPGEKQAGAVVASANPAAGQGGEGGDADMPANYVEHISDEGASDSDRNAFTGQTAASEITVGEGRPDIQTGGEARRTGGAASGPDRQGFRSQRDRERRIPSRSTRRPVRAQVNIQDLLKEGQEVLVQVAKDPIATKGARLTCHISLPGRHLVCMPTIDHVGVSRRIERDEERRRLRDVVERNRPRNLGFIVRTASGKGQAEKRIKQDIDYLSRLWDEIREKSANTTAPALVYEDLNSVLRAIRDWVTDEIDKIIVDSRYHYNEILRFVSHFMPSLKQKVELYHGDIPIFDAYNISTELSRALERKVWLKSGGYLVIDQAEALVAIDVNTGRYVGKKNLEDTILKTNLEAVQEIAYQLRLRNCGGIIILDLIDMEKEENKQRVYRALEEALKRDRARPSILKISELGLVEMTRKRTRDTIVRALCESCSHCEGKGFIKSKTTVAYEVLREIEREGIEKDVSKILVQAHPEVIDILALDERETLDQIERRYRKQIYLQAVVDSHIEQFEVAGDKKPGKTAGDFSEVVQTYRTHSSPDRAGGDRDRGRGGGRDRNRGRSGGRDSNRDNSRGRNQEGPGRDQNRDEQSGGSSAPRMIIRPPQAQVAAQDGQPVNQPNESGVQIIINPARPITVQANEGGQPIIQNSGQSQVQAQGNYDENFGNRAQPEPGNSIVAQPNGNTTGEGDDFYDEEDRLAFLRAQAAQDAALARLRSSGEASPSQNRPPRSNNDRGGGGGAGGRGDRNQRRGRRNGGGKFQNNRGGQGGGQGRGPRQFTPRGPGAGPVINQGGPSASGGGQIVNQEASRDTSREGGSGDDRGGGNEGGSGGHSQPPV